MAKAISHTSTLLQRTLHTSVRDNHGRKQSGIKHSVEVPAAAEEDLADSSSFFCADHVIVKTGALEAITGISARAEKQLLMRDAALALYHIGTPGDLDSADKFLERLPNDISDASKDPMLFRHRIFPTQPWRRLERVLPKLVVHLRLINQCRIALALQRADIHSRVYARLVASPQIAPDASFDKHSSQGELQYCTRQMVKQGDSLRRFHSGVNLGDSLHAELNLTAEDVHFDRISNIVQEGRSSADTRMPILRNSPDSSDAPSTAVSFERGNSNEDNPFVFAGLLSKVTNFLECAQGTLLQASVVLDAVGQVSQNRTQYGIWLGSDRQNDEIDRDAIVSAIEKLTEDEAKMVVVCSDFLNAYDSAVDNAVQTVSRWLTEDIQSDKSGAASSCNLATKPEDKDVELQQSAAICKKNFGSAEVTDRSSDRDPRLPAEGNGNIPELSEIALKAASRHLAARSLISNAEAVYFSAIGFALQEMTQHVSDVADAVSDIFVRCSSEEYDAAVRRKLRYRATRTQDSHSARTSFRPELQRRHSCAYGDSAADAAWFQSSDATLEAIHSTTTESELLRNRSL
jgi:hypothetical protein